MENTLDPTEAVAPETTVVNETADIAVDATPEESSCPQPCSAPAEDAFWREQEVLHRERRSRFEALELAVRTKTCDTPGEVINAAKEYYGFIKGE